MAFYCSGTLLPRAIHSRLYSTTKDHGLKCLNSDAINELLMQIATDNQGESERHSSRNFWPGQRNTMSILSATCIRIQNDGLTLKVEFKAAKDSELKHNTIFVPFPYSVVCERGLKSALVSVANNMGRQDLTAALLCLPFGEDFKVPTDMKFNNVPHPAWVRGYIYNEALTAVWSAINDPLIADKSRLQMLINVPEVCSVVNY